MNLKAPKRNVIVRIMLDNKERYQLTEDIELHIPRGFTFNKREDAPSFGEMIDDETGVIPKGHQVLIHHNSTHESYHINDLSKEDFNVYSIPSDMVFCHRENQNTEWLPYGDYVISLRIFEPYTGLIEGIEHEKFPKHLYIQKGNFEDAEIEGKAVLSKINNDYEIEFFENGRPTSLIRSRLRDILAIDHSITEQVLAGKLLIGKNLKDAKFLKTE